MADSGNPGGALPLQPFLSKDVRMLNANPDRSRVGEIRYVSG